MGYKEILIQNSFEKYSQLLNGERETSRFKLDVITEDKYARRSQNKQLIKLGKVCV